ncbi:hypothetical protein QO034_08210 [Sedimentitalea sp. JM2-8]|uniref:Adenylate cyclase, class 3 n=1 Tax=Sedimentitalea xiamensis TaxID=3050037 RepID=A0ABT7FD95_9RHOB|nr:hypothetical protein [Sedimentitalea xiamensis]MDK3073088.1 hypothetical protein [Sedimentitalea xiamensis]
MERRLAADVAGYSRLMDEESESALAALPRLGAELFTPSVAGNRGKLVKSMGDGWIVTFASALDGTLRPAFDDAGERSLKNIARPIRVWTRGGPRHGPASEPDNRKGQGRQQLRGHPGIAQYIDRLRKAGMPERSARQLHQRVAFPPRAQLDRRG